MFVSGFQSVEILKPSKPKIQAWVEGVNFMELLKFCHTDVKMEIDEYSLKI